jgi:hypothetical protein
VSAAVLSPCGRYRYSLERQVEIEGPRIAWLMLNPSTADGTKDDPTIRKVVGISIRAGYGPVVVVNLFALRETKPRLVKLAYVSRPLAETEGPDNREHILAAARRASAIVCAWGSQSWAAEQARRVLRWLDVEHPEPPRYCLGTNQDGSPRHPLMVAYARALVPFGGRS